MNLFCKQASHGLYQHCSGCHSVAEQEIEKVQSWHFIGAARKVLSDAAPKPQLVWASDHSRFVRDSVRCETDVCIQRSRAKIQKALQKLGASGIRCGFGVSKRGIQPEILKVPHSYSYLLVKKIPSCFTCNYTKLVQQMCNYIIGHFKMWYVVILSICLCKGGKLFVIFSKLHFFHFFHHFSIKSHPFQSSDWGWDLGREGCLELGPGAPHSLARGPQQPNPEKPRGHLKSFEKICIKKPGNCLGFPINIQISSELVKFLNLSSLTRKYGSYVTSQADWELWEMWTM